MVLYYLRQHDHSATMDDLAKQIAAWENQVAIEELTSQQRKRVYVSLYQTHLPKLADTGLIEYDADAGDIELTERAMEVDAFLTPKQDSTYPWRRYYLILVILGGIAMSIGVASTPLLGSSMLPWLAVGILAGYLMTTAIEYWNYRKKRSRIPSELVPQNE